MTLERTTQPMTDAVERPMTLIEKLEQKESEISKMMQADDAPFPYHYMAGKLNGAREALDIVKQHSDWVSVDERLPEREYCEYLVWVGYPDIATYSKFGWELPSDAVITHWQPIQPPSEAQGD